MRNYLTFGSIDSRNFGVYISGTGRLNIPERVYEMTSVPGKMGDVPIDYRKVANAELTYPAFFAPLGGSYGNYATLNAAVGAFRSALLSTHGYAVLTDTYDSTHYRKAVFLGDIDIEPTTVYDAAEFELTFNVAPQRFATLAPITVAADVTKTLTLTEFPADKMNLEPIITVTGTGSITFKDMSDNVLKTITITQNPGTVVINSQLKECYSGSNSANGFVQFSDYQFPVFGAFYGYAGQVKVTTSGVSLMIEPGGFEL